MRHEDCRCCWAMNTDPHLSVVVPLYNEEANVRPLVDALREALEGECWELLLVDDGSRDGTAAVAEQVCREEHRARLVRLARNYGQTAAMQAGFDRARGEVVVTMDGDLQNDPLDIPRLLKKMEEGYDLVAGYRVDRKERLLTRKIPSWVGNWIIAKITRVEIRDNGCSLKAFRKSLLDHLHLYSELHRYIPAVAAATSAARIAEIPVHHHSRTHGESKYGLSRTWRVLIDVATVGMIRWFRDRPLALFGWGAFGSAVVGLAFIAATVFYAPDQADKLVFPGGAAVTFGLSFYLLMLGLVGEAARFGKRRAGASSRGRKEDTR